MAVFLRKYTRLGAVLVWVLTVFAVRFCAQIFHPFSRKLEKRVRKDAFRLGARGVARITGMRIEVQGTPPKPPFYLVSNHLTFLDVFVIGSVLECVFVARDDLAQWPMLGFIIRGMNAVFINRERMRDTVRVNEQLTSAMSDGYGVVVFPESQVSTQGVVLPFKPALLEPAVQLDLHVHYASIHYRTPEGCPPASEVAVWHDDVGLFEHYLNLAALPNFTAVLTFGDSPIPGEDRKTLAKDLHAAVRAQFVPLD